MKVLLTLFVLFFSSSVFAEEIQMKLFGITLLEPIENYSNYDSELNALKPVFYADDEIEGLIRNERFQHYTISYNDEGEIDLITGFKVVRGLEQEHCVEEKEDLIEVLSALNGYERNSFKTDYYKIFINNNMHLREESYIQDNKKQIWLKTSCEYVKYDEIVTFFKLLITTYDKNRKLFSENKTQFIKEEYFNKSLKLLLTDIKGL